jgi:hypothetical protein
MKPSLSMSGLPVRARVGGYAGDALCNALNRLTGAVFEVGIPEADEVEMPEDPLVWRQPFSLAGDAFFWLIAGKDIREAVGQLVLSAAGGTGGDSVSEEDCRSTWNEIAGQTMSGIAQALSVDLGREVAAQEGEQDAESPGDRAEEAVLQTRSGAEVWHVRIAWSNQFAEAVSAISAQAGQMSSFSSENRHTLIHYFSIGSAFDRTPKSGFAFRGAGMHPRPGLALLTVTETASLGTVFIPSCGRA